MYVEGLKLTDKYNIGGGAFADVYKGEFQGIEVAAKKLRVTLYQPPEQRLKTMKASPFSHTPYGQLIYLVQALCREAAIWLHLEHPHVLPFLGIDRTTFDSTACMLSPWMPHGNIHDYITANGFFEEEIHRLVSYFQGFSLS